MKQPELFAMSGDLSLVEQRAERIAMHIAQAERKIAANFGPARAGQAENVRQQFCNLQRTGLPWSKLYDILSRQRARWSYVGRPQGVESVDGNP